MFALSSFCLLGLSLIIHQVPVVSGHPAGTLVLPDIIRRAAIDAGNTAVNTTGNGTAIRGEAHPGDFTFDLIPPALADAYVKQDRKAIETIRKQAQDDLKPIYANIASVGSKAWTPILDEPTGKTFWLTYSGAPDNPISYMWVFPTQVTSSTTEGETDANAGRFSYSNVMQVGTLSRNTGYLGVSTQDWKEKAATDAVVAPFLVKTISRFIKKRFGGIATKAASEEAVAEAGEEVVAEGAATALEVEALGSFMALAVTGGAAAVVVALLLYVLTDIFVREYKLSITVNNWSDQNDYVIESYFGRNEAIDNQDTFKEAVLPRETTQIRFPDGFKANTSLQITRCNYNFVNSNQFLEGLAVAMEAEGPAGTAFRFKYDLARVEKNRLGLEAPIGQESLPAYLNDNSWEPRGSYGVTKKLTDGTPITVFTNDLSGRNDRFYEFTINIGQPFKIDAPAEPLKPIVPASSDRKPQDLKKGDKILLPLGTFGVVGSGVGGQGMLNSTAGNSSSSANTVPLNTLNNRPGDQPSIVPLPDNSNTGAATLGGIASS